MDLNLAHIKEKKEVKRKKKKKHIHWSWRFTPLPSIEKMMPPSKKWLLEEKFNL